MSTLNGVVDNYLEIWNEKDDVKRLARLKDLFTEDAGYTDPLASVTGPEALDQVIAAAQKQFAGLVFSRGETFEEHHHIARFTWHLGPAADAEPLAVGFDVLAVDEAGRITGVFGFIDRMPGA